VLLGLRAAPKEAADTSAAEAVYGLQLTLPGQRARPAELAEWPTIPSTVPPPPQSVSPLSPIVSGFCFVRQAAGPSLRPLFDGPYRILAEHSKLVLVQMGRQQQWISRDRVKPYKGVAVPIPADRRRRGRPRKSGGREGPSSYSCTVESEIYI
jgi:hypothetical protein